MNTTVDTMTTEQFWTIVATLGWGMKADTTSIKLALMRQLTPAQAEAFDARFCALRAALDKKIAKAVDCLGDDSYTDLCAHIIGLGEAEYTATLARPSKARARAAAGNFAESFAYVIPNDRDYLMTSPAYWAAKVSEIVKDYRLSVAAGEVPGAETDIIIAALNKLGAGDVAGFLGDKDAVLVAAKHARSNVYLMSNVYSDVSTFLGAA